jgi:hypothetical protein
VVLEECAAPGANVVLDVLNENFDDRVLSNCFPEWFRYGWSWPPYAPDLNPCDYFLWGFLKDTVYKNNLHTIKELQQEILAAEIIISEETPAANVHNFRHWLQMVLDANGAYIENVFHMIVNLPRLMNSETPNTVMYAMLLGNYMQLKLEHLFKKTVYLSSRLRLLKT